MACGCPHRHTSLSRAPQGSAGTANGRGVPRCQTRDRHPCRCTAYLGSHVRDLPHETRPRHGTTDVVRLQPRLGSFRYRFRGRPYGRHSRLLHRRRIPHRGHARRSQSLARRIRRAGRAYPPNRRSTRRATDVQPETGRHVVPRNRRSLARRHQLQPRHALQQILSRTQR